MPRRRKPLTPEELAALEAADSAEAASDLGGRILGRAKGYQPLSPSELEARGLSPTSRRVLTPEGLTISRRQYENERLRAETGWRTWSEFQRARLNPQYQYYMQRYSDAQDVDAKLARQVNSEFNRAYQAALPAIRNRKSDLYKDPNGPMARFLVLLGLRDPGQTNDVGTS